MPMLWYWIISIQDTKQVLYFRSMVLTFTAHKPDIQRWNTCFVKILVLYLFISSRTGFTHCIVCRIWKAQIHSYEGKTSYMKQAPLIDCFVVVAFSCNLNIKTSKLKGLSKEHCIIQYCYSNPTSRAN